MRAISPSEISSEIFINDDEIDLRRYLYLLSNYKWAIIGLTCVVTLLSTLYVFSLPPFYQATATVLIETEKENIVSIEEVYGFQGSNYEYYQTQLAILKSRELAGRVVDRLKLAGLPNLGASVKEPAVRINWRDWLPDWESSEEKAPPEKKSEEALRIAAVNQVLAMLSVSYVSDSQLIKISFSSGDPKLAARLANALAEVYIESGLEAQLESTRKATSWITEQLKELKQKVDESEKELQAFLDKERLVDAKGVDSIAVNKLDEVSRTLIEARRQTSEAQEFYHQVTALEGQPVEAYESIPAVLKDTSVHQAKITQAQAERKVSELAKRYGPKHPKMIAAQSELVSANKNVQAQIKNVIESIKKEYSIARANESHINSTLSATKKEVAQINRVGYELKSLEHEVASNRNLYDMFLTRFKETSATDDLQSANARIIDSAMVPSSPYKPNKQRFILISLLVGLMLSIAIVFIIESLDNTLKDTKDVENKLFLPVLSILPKLNVWLNKDTKKMRYFSDKKHSSFSENIRTIRTSVLLKDIDESNKSILVTSSVPGEGKSIVAINLALAMGQMGKVLLIDADMRKPSIAKVFGLNHHDSGLSHFIAGSQEIQQCVYHFEKEKIHVMPAGQIPSNPLELLSSNRFKNGLEALRKSFDHIIIDAAPAVPVSDAIVLSRLVSATIYVVKADDTPYQLAAIGIKKLNQVNANIAGVVLNQVNATKRPGRYGYAESDYYSYYGYGKS